MVIEVLSPSTEKNDRIVKLKKYREAGVKEYWIVDPADCSVQVLILLESPHSSKPPNTPKSPNTPNTIYGIEVYEEEDTISVGILEDCMINLKEIFEEF